MIRRALAATLAGLIIAALSLMGAGTASAHAARIAAEPAADAVLETGPPRVAATFNEALQSNFAGMTVVGPDGNMWSTGPVEVSGAVASVAMLPTGPAGVYTVNYRVTSADGHVVSGSWSFQVTVAGTGSPGPAVAQQPANGADSGVPVWPFVAVAAVIVGGGAWWAVRRRS
ncbi:copper resistance CopC family protein [Mycolicibacterium sp. YH-1]|uniref:copper resistance CopC family protein n=1 Tax=Mycolicibacterium sp. YH-1 TaxID=2908837 RepID=UPI001F4BDCAB|nr:copper resistance CopC family protein [Mycolicibacterium sp. YH-1]UNB53055.1 copper resistance protein CopC [Mycolicibacterium sp. YH-1]